MHRRFMSSRNDHELRNAIIRQVICRRDTNVICQIKQVRSCLVQRNTASKQKQKAQTQLSSSKGTDSRTTTTSKRYDSTDPPITWQHIDLKHAWTQEQNPPEWERGMHDLTTGDNNISLLLLSWVKCKYVAAPSVNAGVVFINSLLLPFVYSSKVTLELLVYGYFVIFLDGKRHFNLRLDVVHSETYTASEDLDAYRLHQLRYRTGFDKAYQF